MRLPEYLEIFEQTGFDVIHLEFDKVDNKSQKYNDFKKLNLHEDFLKFSEQDLLAGSINVLLRKK